MEYLWLNIDLDNTLEYLWPGITEDNFSPNKNVTRQELGVSLDWICVRKFVFFLSYVALQF